MTVLVSGCLSVPQDAIRVGSYNIRLSPGDKGTPNATFQGFGRYKDGPVDRKGVAKDYCIDYIYVSEGTRVLDVVTHDDKRSGTDLYPSDHFPVTATVVLP